MKTTQEVEIRVPIDHGVTARITWEPFFTQQLGAYPGYGMAGTRPVLLLTARGKDAANLVQSLHRLGDAILDAVEGKGVDSSSPAGYRAP